MITHRVTIEPTHRSPKRQFYKATLNGDEIVARSADPEFAACRVMKLRGLSGKVEFYRPGASFPGLIVHDLGKAASLRVVETDSRGADLKRWRTFDMVHGLHEQD